MNNNTFTVVNGISLWNIGNVFELAVVRNRFRNKYIVKKQLETEYEFSVSKLNALLCDFFVLQKETTFYDINLNYESLHNTTRQTLDYYTLIGKEDLIAELISTLTDYSIKNMGLMYHYNIEAEMMSIGVHTAFKDIVDKIKEAKGYGETEAIKVMYYTHCIFNSSVMDISYRAMSTVLKEALITN